jgi:two-component system, OmpR family, sensor kinase
VRSRRWHDHHHHRHFGHGPRWVGWRLRKRIFVSFAFAIVLGVCLGGFLHHHGVKPVFAVAATILVLWGMAGAIAWRLTQPLNELARVAKQLGEGKLDARMHSHPRARELTAIATAVNEMAERIEKQLRDQRELLAAVSHEIRTPLGHMRVLLDTARERDVPEPMIAELEREVLEVDALVDQLLASSRLDFGTLERRELDVAVEAARALERLGVDAAVLDVESDDCRVSADPTLLRSALANLVRNAVEHGGGVSRVAVRRTLEAVEVDVEDTGPGFTDADLPQVFQPFFRGRGTGGGDKPARGSLGLGLSLVDRIAQGHGGSARAGNRDGGGARVTLRLPAISR